MLAVLTIWRDFVKRVLSFLLCCTLCIGIFAYRPVQVKAVAGVDDAAVVGSMALASYLSATGLELSVIEGGAATVTAGLGTVAGEYAAATGAAASGEAVLGGIAAGTMISAVGTIVLTAAAVAVCAGLAYWLVDTYFVNEDIEVVPVYSCTTNGGVISVNVDGYSPFTFQYTDIGGSGGYETSPLLACEKLNEYTVYRYLFDPVIVDYHEWPSSSGRYFFYFANSYTGSSSLNYVRCLIDKGNENMPGFTMNSLSNYLDVSGYNYGDAYLKYEGLTWLRCGNYLVLNEVMSYNGSYYFGKNYRNVVNYFSSGKYTYGDISYLKNELLVTRIPTYTIPEIQDFQQMEITVPSASPGSTLAELVETVPQQIADNEFTASYTIDDFAPEPAPETAGMLDYVADIWRKIKALPETISNALRSVFEPDAALLQEITATFNNKFGWLDVIYQLGVDLCNLEPESQPPVIYIHLEDAEGQFRYGGTEKALDMSWYQPYKEDVDNILSGFMWLAFLWLVFKRAADIINGAGMVSDYEFYTSVPINQPRLGEHKK